MVRKFETGATRDSDDGKLDFEGFLCPLVLKRYAEYMHAHRKQSDGCMRDSDNWQKGIPPEQYIKSAFRHFFDLWSEHRGIDTPDGIENDACAMLFNISGFLHEYLKRKAQNAKATLEPSRIATTGELAYLASFGSNRSSHPMQAEAERISEWERENGSGL